MTARMVANPGLSRCTHRPYPQLLTLLCSRQALTLLTAILRASSQPNASEYSVAQRRWPPRSAIDYQRTSFKLANASRRGGTMVSWNGEEEEGAQLWASYKCISIETNSRQ